MPDKWDLLFTFPNLAPPVPTPFESDGYVVCSGSDPRLDELHDNAGNETALEMLNRFSTGAGTRYRPGCLLVRSNIPVAARRQETLAAFRNICAIATISAFRATLLAHPYAAQWRVAWSDHFRFGPYITGHSGWVQAFGGPVRGMDDEIPSQKAAGGFGNPTDFTLLIDQQLLGRLFKAWRRCYLQGRDRIKFRRLFRALEVAFHASSYPADGLTSINDVGIRLALWVSAFEVLCHPGGNVDKRVVQAEISQTPFLKKRLLAKRFTVSHRQTDYRATLPEALYDDLYWTRNQFLHGMPVRSAMLNYRQSPRFARLLDVAPVLFNATLVSRLNTLGVADGPLGPNLPIGQLARYLQSRQGLDRVEDGLVAAGESRQ